MNSYIHRSTRALFGRHSRMRFAPHHWHGLIDELGRRGGGVRESGAFILASPHPGPSTAQRIVYFDDLDPGCLNGGISMRGSAFGDLWKICRTEHLRVAADVHTHPGELVSQSHIDRANPMVASNGHVSIIVPDLASRSTAPRECGVHIYQGAHRWSSHLGDQAARVLYVGRCA